MTDCHRCGYPNLARSFEHDGQHYGPECIEVVKGGRRDLIAEQRAPEVPRLRRAYCDRCDIHLSGIYTKQEHRELLRRHHCH